MDSIGLQLYTYPALQETEISQSETEISQSKLNVYGVSYSEGCVYMDTPPCKIHTVYMCRISQGGLSINNTPSIAAVYH
jgi:hypothetical protein